MSEVVTSNNAIAIYDHRLDELIRPDAALEKIVSAAVWSEGACLFS